MISYGVVSCVCLKHKNFDCRIKFKQSTNIALITHAMSAYTSWNY